MRRIVAGHSSVIGPVTVRNTASAFDGAGTEGGPFAGKYPVRLWLRAASAAPVTAEICYDGGSWETAAVISPGSQSARYLPVPVRRCGRFALRLRCPGAWTLRAMAVEVRARGGNRQGTGAPGSA